MNTPNKEALERKKNSMKMWICNHYSESNKYSTPDSKFHYLFPVDSHITMDDPQRGRVGVFLHDGEKVMVGYASFFNHGGLEAFPDQEDWREHSKFEGVEIWKLMIRSGSHYHFDPKTSVHCVGTKMNALSSSSNKTSQYALEA